MTKNIINAIIKQAKEQNKDAIILELLNHIDLNYDFENKKEEHILECLLNSNNIVTKNDIDIDYIKNNLDLLIYNSKDYIIKNINIKNIDNISCCIYVTFDYLEKINKNRNDVTYHNSFSTISFIDYNDMLKKS